MENKRMENNKRLTLWKTKEWKTKWKTKQNHNTFLQVK